jgi:hypothetical protein
MTLSKATSFNNKLVLEAYVHTEIRPEGNRGWIQASQKTNLKGLKVLVQAVLPDGTIVLKNSIAFIKEELLHSAPFAKNKLKCQTIPVEFILATMNDVEWIEPPEEGGLIA